MTEPQITRRHLEAVRNLLGVIASRTDISLQLVESAIHALDSGTSDPDVDYLRRAIGSGLALGAAAQQEIARNLGLEIPEPAPTDTLGLVAAEYRRAVALHPRWASAHEGIALLFEEICELWDEVRKRRDARDPDAMRREAIQVAAMAVRFVEEICRPEIAGRGEGMVS